MYTYKQSNLDRTQRIHFKTFRYHIMKGRVKDIIKFLQKQIRPAQRIC